MSLIPLRAVDPFDVLLNLLDHCLSVIPSPRKLPFFRTNPWKTHIAVSWLVLWVGRCKLGDVLQDAMFEHLTPGDLLRSYVD